MTEDEEISATYDLARKIIHILDGAGSGIVVGALAVCTAEVLTSVCPTEEVAHEGADRFAACVKEGISLRVKNQNKTPN